MEQAMKILVILAHPNPASFNHAIAAQAVATLKQNGHEVFFHDLYAEGFDPILPAAEIPADGPVPPAIREHCRELSQVQGLIIVHPNWWGQPPAILKGWVDRVFRPGVAYKFAEGDGGEGVPLREAQVFRDPLETLWRICIFALCGVQLFQRKTFAVVVTSTPTQRQAWLREVADLVAEHFPANAG
jgi:putative NADPH-quinone reductase